MYIEMYFISVSGFLLGNVFIENKILYSVYYVNFDLIVMFRL